MLLRLAYLAMTNVFALVRLLPMSDRDKDAVILALRHQITVWGLGNTIRVGDLRFPVAPRGGKAATSLPSSLPAGHACILIMMAPSRRS